MKATPRVCAQALIDTAAADLEWLRKRKQRIKAMPSTKHSKELREYLLGVTEDQIAKARDRVDRYTAAKKKLSRKRYKEIADVIDKAGVAPDHPEDADGTAAGERVVQSEGCTDRSSQ